MESQLFTLTILNFDDIRLVFSGSLFEILGFSHIEFPTTSTFKNIYDILAIAGEISIVLPGELSVSTESERLARFNQPISMVGTWFSTGKQTDGPFSRRWPRRKFGADQVVAKSLWLSGPNYHTAVLECFFATVTAYVLQDSRNDPFVVL